jgi:uncharacterized protein (TIGR03437 family)
MSRLNVTALAVVLCLSASYRGFAQQNVTATYSFNGLPIPILNDAANVISIANIVVPRAIKMTKVTAQVQLQYPNSGDLKVYLFSPQGTRTILLEHDCSVVNVDTTFDDSAPSLWKDFCPTQAGQGPFRPDQPLSNFNSDNSSFGIWRLAVQNDQSDSRTGWITAVSLTITGTGQLTPITSPTAIVNAASLSGNGTIAPGEMISIFGASIGPNPAVSAPSGALPTSLGGTSVTIDGTPAPIAYASPFRVDVQVPFKLAPTGTTSSIVVTSSGGTSPSAPVSVTSAAPGVYVNGTGGPGPAVATNQDGSLNSALKPAAKGSIVIFYASGLGAVSPPLTEGQVPPDSPLSNVVAPVGAFIGGVPAAVQFAGLAPGFPGLYQLNIQVPLTAPSGAQDLVVYSNGIASQSGVTIQIQ